ncbi:MAG: ring-hydroxylating oxygenase subunit alpha [Gammaproteobacteria bacterium]|nr:ring-hydroxylating oxygenase subunit alpha [Gammaproteobacteria bacterium]MCY4217694.1 ring-hydroxylating oxygenase subunit alpha [Gammaproteobacteria bacterium]
MEQEEFDRISSGYVTDPLKSWSLNASCYNDAKFLDIERSQIFYRSWQYFCHAEKLKQPGSYFTAQIQGQPIFAIRDHSGELRAFYNVCKHRGHELLEGEGNRNLIVCPYHAWSYRLDGKLQAARRSEYISNFSAEDVCLDAIQIEIFCDLVFVNLDPGAESLSTQSGNLGQEIRSFAPDIAELKFAHRLTYTIKANWKTVIDNFLECYHCPVAHKDFCTLVDMNSYQVRTHGIYSSHMAKAGLSSNQAYDVTNATVTDHAVWYLWPNIALLRYPGRGNFMVWKFIPVGPEETHEEFDFFYETEQPIEAELEAIRFIDEILQPEDIGLVESVQRGMRTPGFQQGRYLVDPQQSGMSEHAVHHFHGLVLGAYQRACLK